MPKCEVCQKGLDEGALHRVNDTGVTGIWRHKNCLTHDQRAAIDPVVEDIGRIIEEDNKRRSAER
jgi:hypothetical protein